MTSIRGFRAPSSPNPQPCCCWDWAAWCWEERNNAVQACPEPVEWASRLRWNKSTAEGGYATWNIQKASEKFRGLFCAMAITFTVGVLSRLFYSILHCHNDLAGFWNFVFFAVSPLLHIYFNNRPPISAFCKSIIYGRLETFFSVFVISVRHVHIDTFTVALSCCFA